MRVYWCQGPSLPYEPIKFSRYCWKRQCFCWGSNKNNKWVYLNSYQALIKTCLAVEQWEVGSAAYLGCLGSPRGSHPHSARRWEFLEFLTFAVLVRPCPVPALAAIWPGWDRALGNRDMAPHSSGVTLHGCFLLHLLCAGFSYCGHPVELRVVFDIPHSYRPYP